MMEKHYKGIFSFIVRPPLYPCHTHVAAPPTIFNRVEYVKRVQLSFYTERGLVTPNALYMLVNHMRLF